MSETAVVGALSEPLPSDSEERRGRLRVAGAGIAATVLGAAPHVLHHAGPLAGAAILGGVGGSLLFGAAGLLLAIPMLLRVRRRTDSWKAPAGLLAIFAVLFTLSTTVFGPTLTGSDDTSSSPTQSEPDRSPGANPADHDAHHD